MMLVHGELAVHIVLSLPCDELTYATSLGFAQAPLGKHTFELGHSTWKLQEWQRWSARQIGVWPVQAACSASVHCTQAWTKGSHTPSPGAVQSEPFMHDVPASPLVSRG
jgi:hypothetical protein